MLAMTHLMDQRRNCSVAKGHCSLQPERVNDFETPGVMRLASERFD